MPSGVIVMWSGTLASIPQGWSLCDGLGGRPDLRDRFIMGWTDAVEPGGTGGAATHTHDDHTGVINHTHPVTDPNHAHGELAPSSASAGALKFGIDTNASGSQAAGLNTAAAATGVTTENPAGGVAALSHVAGDHTPAYYKLAFIIQD